MAELRIIHRPAGGGNGETRVPSVVAGSGRSWPGEAEQPSLATVCSGCGSGFAGTRARWWDFPADRVPHLRRLCRPNQRRRGGPQPLLCGVLWCHGAGIWERSPDGLRMRVDEDDRRAKGPGWAWELLRGHQPLHAAVAHGAGAFVRTHFRAAGHQQLPEPGGGPGCGYCWRPPARAGGRTCRSGRELAGRARWCGADGGPVFPRPAPSHPEAAVRGAACGPGGWAAVSNGALRRP